MAQVDIGAVAPDFILPDEKNKTVRLADYKGKQPVVLIFYPMDQTPGCTAQMCAARDSNALYEQAGVALYGINGGSAESHQKFINKYSLTAPLLVDRGLAVAERYGATLGFGPLKLINRTVVGIGKDGRIVFYRRGTPATEEIIAAFS